MISRCPSTLGFAIDPQPFDGKVVAATDDAIVVKLKPSASSRCSIPTW
jgi:hypothetical protein